MAPRTYTTTLRHAGLYFGEAPRWHEGRLWYSDFYRRSICSLGDDGERVEHVLDDQPSGLGWLPDGTLLCVSMRDQRIIAIDADGTSRVHADIAAHCGYWANDMVVSARGTAYVGNFGFDLDRWIEAHGPASLIEQPGPPTTSLVVVAPDGAIVQAVDDMAFPNGSVITPDGSTLVVAETMRQRLTAFDIAGDGTLSNRRTFAELDLVFCDGICLDAEGQLWVAAAIAPECVRVAEGGAITARAATTQRAFACMLGGHDRQDLYVMTAPSSTAEHAAARPSGAIEVARVDVPGAGLP